MENISATHVCVLLTTRFRKVADKGIDLGAHPACCWKLMGQHEWLSVRIISSCFRCVLIGAAWLLLHIFQRKSQWRQLLSTKLSLGCITIYPLMTHSQQEISKSSLSIKHQWTSCYFRGRKNKQRMSGFGHVIHFTATWQISLASVTAQLRPSTLRGDLKSLLTLTDPERAPLLQILHHTPAAGSQHC